MIIISIIQDIYSNLLETSWLEGIAVLTGLLSVWFARKENILVYPTGIVSVLIYVYLCYEVGLYAETGINMFYFIMSIYGWYNWSRKDENKKHIPIKSANKGELLVSFATLILFFFSLSYLLKTYTDSTVPYLDGLVTSIFIIGMWLMAIKKIENWIAWIIGDLISIPLYTYKGLALTSFQFAVFLILAVSGYIEWKKKLKSEN